MIEGTVLWTCTPFGWVCQPCDGLTDLQIKDQCLKLTEEGITFQLGHRCDEDPTKTDPNFIMMDYISGRSAYDHKQDDGKMYCKIVSDGLHCNHIVVLRTICEEGHYIQFLTCKTCNEIIHRSIFETKYPAIILWQTGPSMIIHY